MMYDPVILETKDTGSDKVKLLLQCKRCGGITELEITDDQYKALLNGDGHIQDILLGVPAGIREMFLSGNCDKCWKEMFPPQWNEED